MARRDGAPSRGGPVVQQALHVDEIEPTPEFLADLGQTADFAETQPGMQPEGRFVARLHGGDQRVEPRRPRPVHQRRHQGAADAGAMARAGDENGCLRRRPIPLERMERAERRKSHDRARPFGRQNRPARRLALRQPNASFVRRHRMIAPHRGGLRDGVVVEAGQGRDIGGARVAHDQAGDVGARGVIARGLIGSGLIGIARRAHGAPRRAFAPRRRRSG